MAAEAGREGWDYTIRRNTTGHYSDTLLAGRNKAKIALEAAPDAVDVVRRVPGRIGLHVEEHDDERRPLDAVGVRPTGLVILPRDGEVDVLQPRLPGLLQLRRGDVRRHP